MSKASKEQEELTNTSSHNIFYLIATLLTFSIVAFPIFQLIKFNGLVFYTNALDEGSYLQYDFSNLAIVTTARFSQRIVSWLHETGLSGGQINFLFDMLLPFSIIVFSYKIFRKLFYSPYVSTSLAILVTSFPLLINCFNPLVAYLFEFLVNTKSLSWITMPQADFSPILRTPEPQLSLFLILISIYLSLTRNNIIYLILCTPFIYSFMAIPWCFIIWAITLDKLLKSYKINSKIILLVAFISLSIGLNLYFNYFIDPRTRGLLLNSSLPLVSYSGLICLVVYNLFKNYIEPNKRFLALAILVAPWVSANHQIISGWVAVPSNSEQYFGVYCVLALLVLVVGSKHVRITALCYASLVLFILSNFQTFTRNYNYTANINNAPEVLEWLSEDASLVATNDPLLSVILNLVYPMQSATFFSYSKVYLGQVQMYLSDYKCAKKLIQSNANLASSFDKFLRFMDVAVQNETEDYYLNTLFRRNFDAPKFDVLTLPVDCHGLDLKYMTLD